jgi:hypothetical protein
MDITRANFAEIFPLIKESIHTAEFIGFDTEFSGNKMLIDNSLQDSMSAMTISSTITTRLRTGIKN